MGHEQPGSTELRQGGAGDVPGRVISKRVDYSELTAQKIDNEVKTIIMECYAKTRSIVESNLDSCTR
jgi:ATP-dependent Zn protease